MVHQGLKIKQLTHNVRNQIYMLPCKFGVTDLRGCGKDVSPKHINLPQHCIC